MNQLTSSSRFPLPPARVSRECRVGVWAPVLGETRTRWPLAPIFASRVGGAQRIRAECQITCAPYSLVRRGLLALGPISLSRPADAKGGHQRPGGESC